MEETMTLEQFRQAKQSGEDLYAEPQQSQEDAVPEQEYEQEETQEQPDVQQQQEEADDEPQIPKEQQSAWAKRAERERRKATEEAETRLKAEYESQLNPYKQFFDQLGMKPEDAMRAIEQNKLRQEAEQLAYQNGWDEQQTQWYMQNQQNQKEMHDLRVSVQINDLADSSNYPGIKQMKGAISDFIKRNPSASVNEAYWAVGGANLASQLKLEAEQREIAKRSQQPRKVVKDTGQTMDTKGALPPEALAFMQKTKMSEAQVRMLMGDTPITQEQFRNSRRK
jgi:hypothetical protein